MKNKTETLDEKRKELLNNILKIEDKSSHIAIRGLFLQIEEQDKEFIRRLLKEMPYEREFIENLAGKSLLGEKK